MTRETSQEQVVCRGERVILRDALPGDSDAYVRWMTGGEWREYDAPWELVEPAPPVPVLWSNFQRRWLRAREHPRQRLIIATEDDIAVGWVTRYGETRFEDCWNVGICIGEDAWLGRGLGTEALRLWIDYLFANSKIHRLGLLTYSFNIRMIRVAEKVGVRPEGTDREIINWKGEWIDRVRFGILRWEWEKQART
jgi:RimJ/RimL family protein N-acetyltransferase